MKCAQQRRGSALYSAIMAKFISWLVLLGGEIEQKKKEICFNHAPEGIVSQYENHKTAFSLLRLLTNNPFRNHLGLERNSYLEIKPNNLLWIKYLLCVKYIPRSIPLERGESDQLPLTLF